MNPRRSPVLLADPFVYQNSTLDPTIKEGDDDGNTRLNVVEMANLDQVISTDTTSLLE